MKEPKWDAEWPDSQTAPLVVCRADYAYTTQYKTSRLQCFAFICHGLRIELDKCKFYQHLCGSKIITYVCANLHFILIYIMRLRLQIKYLAMALLNMYNVQRNHRIPINLDVCDRTPTKSFLLLRTSSRISCVRNCSLRGSVDVDDVFICWDASQVKRASLCFARCRVK